MFDFSNRKKTKTISMIIVIAICVAMVLGLLIGM